MFMFFDLCVTKRFRKVACFSRPNSNQVRLLNWRYPLCLDNTERIRVRDDPILPQRARLPEGVPLPRRRRWLLAHPRPGNRGDFFASASRAAARYSSACAADAAARHTEQRELECVRSRAALDARELGDSASSLADAVLAMVASGWPEKTSEPAVPGPLLRWEEMFAAPTLFTFR